MKINRDKLKITFFLFLLYANLLHLPVMCWTYKTAINNYSVFN